MWACGVLNLYLQLHIYTEWFTPGILTSCNDEHDRLNVVHYIYIYISESSINLDQIITEYEFKTLFQNRPMKTLYHLYTVFLLVVCGASGQSTYSEIVDSKIGTNKAKMHKHYTYQWIYNHSYFMEKKLCSCMWIAYALTVIWRIDQL